MGFLLLALIALAAFVYRLHLRIGALEREVQWLREGASVEAPRVATRRAEPVRAPAAEPAAERVAVSPPSRERLPEAPSPSMLARETKAAEQESSAPNRPNVGGLFEQLVGGRLLIWIGGIALAVAGVFLVRYSIGLITPAVRMILAALFGAALVGAGEFARWRPGKVVDPRVAQSLVGAGVLVFYAAAYGSQILYGLISAQTALALMSAITVAALLLSLRHGAATAVMGLAGGFATPLLVGNPSDSSVPLLTYLALLDIALFVIAGRRGWGWLAVSAVVLSFAWTAVLATMAPGHALPAGVFIVLLSFGGSLVKAGEERRLAMLRPAAIGLVELALLVGRLDLGLPAWGLFAVLSLGCLVLAARTPENRLLPALALTLALLLLLIKAIDLPDPMLRFIAAGITLVFAGGGLVGALRGRDRGISVAVASTGFAGPVLILRLCQGDLLVRPGWALLMAALALGPIFLAWSRRAIERDGKADAPSVLATGTGALLLAIAGVDLLPLDLVGTFWMLIGLCIALAGQRTSDRGLAGLAAVGTLAGLVWSAVRVFDLWAASAMALSGDPALVDDLPPLGQGLLVLLPAALILLAAWRLLAKSERLARVALAAGGFAAGAVAYLLYKHMFALAGPEDFIARGLAERTVLNQLLFVAGWAICHRRLPLPLLSDRQRWMAAVALTGLAAARLVWFDMMIHNPVFVVQSVGSLPLLNLVLPAYLLSAWWLYRARRVAGNEARSGLWLTLALAALLFGVMLLVRQAFQGAILTAPTVGEGESYSYSLAALLLSLALIVGGIRLADKPVRIAGLALLAVTIVKVFGLDAAALTGLLRILSLFGLGVGLIGIGLLYGRVLRAEAEPGPGAGAAGSV
ncbi:DUF2339 domain-containing protein [Allosphingosinicella deserti]|uniref:DUF2339 domain-containing protein n=1 Tax=Allosphingosinicella deserti TaxID=2116704 RepID=A0A2P7QFV1_9SPHN|nr:DUF2339 domain-containing protein [Sphingomonas deserti]PSJ36872.1 hypothetical protein C7I55_24490 [Sphingomonas deserti]